LTLHKPKVAFWTQCIAYYIRKASVLQTQYWWTGFALNDFWLISNMCLLCGRSFVRKDYVASASGIFVIPPLIADNQKYCCI